MDIRGGKENVNARPGGLLQGFPGALYVFTSGAGQARDNGAPHRRGDGTYCLKVAIGGNRKPSFDYVYPQPIQLPRHAEFFFNVHAAAGRLLTIAQGRVEYRDPSPFHFAVPPNRVGAPPTVGCADQGPEPRRRRRAAGAIGSYGMVAWTSGLIKLIILQLSLVFLNPISAPYGARSSV